MADKHETHSSARKIAVLGGGLAGMSAARRLLDLGYQVTLVEKRPFLGGRAYSFKDFHDGTDIDNGQHIFLGCCTYYIDYLKAIGTIDNAYLQDRFRAEVILDGKSGILSSTPLLGKLHLLPSFLSYPHLSFKDKLLAVYGLLRIKLADRSKKSTILDKESGYDWLKRHHQSEHIISNLWNLIILPTLNDDVRDVSADMTLMVLQESLLKRPSDAAIGLSRVGLTSLNGEPSHRFIEDRGGEIIVGKSVRSIRTREGRVCGVELSNGKIIEADTYISALPYKAVLQTLPKETTGNAFFSKASGLQSSPIVGIHIWYDRPIMNQEFVAFLNSPVQWVFNKSLIQGDKGSGSQYVCISISGAWCYVNKPKQELKELFVEEMTRLFPRSRDAQIERFLVVKEPDATFRSVPGASNHRLSHTTPISNLFLAGEWTDTGWPSTMEGAVRSGVFAANLVAEQAR